MSLPSAVIAMLVFMSLTISRVYMITKIKTCKMFGGVNPDEWFGPWVTDSTMGCLLPVVVGIAAYGQGRVLWGILVGYNCIGAYDYANGLMCQFMSPQADGQFPPTAIYASVGFGCFCNLVALCLLFTKAAMNYYIVGEIDYAAGTLGPGELLAMMIPCVLVVVVGAVVVAIRRSKLVVVV
jgi:hypothetical protein